MHARVTSKQSIYVETKGSDCVRWKKQNNAEPVILNVTLIANASGLYSGEVKVQEKNPADDDTPMVPHNKTKVYPGGWELLSKFPLHRMVID